MPDEPDGDLLRRFVHGDAAAFEVLFRQFGPDVRRWILRILRDASAADDALVEAFWRAHRGRARFDPSRSFGAWMRRIATNVAQDHLRNTRRGRWMQRADDRIPAPSGPDPGVTELVAKAFAALPPKLRVVATLALIEERPYTEIADALNVPIGTVKSRAFRAIRLLRAELARTGLRS
jgi:RNA polymerase sigma-70 factor (ECF subfamily)